MRLEIDLVDHRPTVDGVPGDAGRRLRGPPVADPGHGLTNSCRPDSGEPHEAMGVVLEMEAAAPAEHLVVTRATRQRVALDRTPQRRVVPDDGAVDGGEVDTIATDD